MSLSLLEIKESLSGYQIQYNTLVRSNHVEFQMMKLKEYPFCCRWSRAKEISMSLFDRSMRFVSLFMKGLIFKLRSLSSGIEFVNSFGTYGHVGFSIGQLDPIGYELLVETDEENLVTPQDVADLFTNASIGFVGETPSGSCQSVPDHLARLIGGESQKLQLQIQQSLPFLGVRKLCISVLKKKPDPDGWNRVEFLKPSCVHLQSPSSTDIHSLSVTELGDLYAPLDANNLEPLQFSVCKVALSDWKVSQEAEGQGFRRDPFSGNII